MEQTLDAFNPAWRASSARDQPWAVRRRVSWDRARDLFDIVTHFLQCRRSGRLELRIRVLPKRPSGGSYDEDSVGLHHHLLCCQAFLVAPPTST